MADAPQEITGDQPAEQPAILPGVEVVASRINDSEGASTGVTHKNYEIKSITLRTENGIDIDIRLQVQRLEIYFDLFGNCSSGQFIIYDGNDLISGYVSRTDGSVAAPLAGLENLDIEIDVKVESESVETINKLYRIDKISKMKPSTNGSQMYLVHFVSQPKIRSLTSKISKSYKGEVTSNIVREICRDQLGITNLDIDSTTSKHDVIIPNLRPLQAISWLASKSYSGEEDVCFFFYETNDKFKFKSLQKLYDQAPKYTKPYTFGSKIVDDNAESRNPQFEIIDYTVREFDMQAALITGGIGSKMLGVDIFNQTTNIYEESFSKNIGSSLNGNLPFYDTSLVSEKYDSFYLTSNEVKDQPGVSDNDVKYTIKRAQTMAMMKHFSITIHVPGNWDLSPGDIVNVTYPKHKVTEHGKTPEQNPYRNGKFLVTAVNHVLEQGMMRTTAELCSDSLVTALPG